ncbi:NADPH-dependent FMN reductase [Tunicatimonas pelagia]|uniref:NADPH-dependent FMN reductase n=1 Tax=Tunicatimonas pelagia TaxID=931531 RepID=UPI0026665C5B|nr:NAD(P)H-dependent oxidoreductase [Tunicatimonas pelagia]WKN41371.1 NAD(P)H-dependent oxidoreductase [Tunicatimonas pelagia]
MTVIIVGTNRRDANSRTIAAYYQRLLSDKGETSQMLDLIDLPADFLTTALYENNGQNEKFNAFRQVLKDNNRFVFIVPEYNGSFPGVLKAFIDGLDYPSSLAGKKAALVGVAAGMHGGNLALSHLTDVLHYLGMQVLPQKPTLAFIHSHLSNEEITNSVYQQLLEQQAEKLTAEKTSDTFQ